MPVTGAPALDTPIPQFYTNALQMRQQQHELQMRVGLQLAQMRQGDLHFQQEQTRLKTFHDDQQKLSLDQLGLSFRSERRLADTAANNNYIRSVEAKTKADGMGVEVGETQAWKDFNSKEVPAAIRRMRERGIEEDSLEWEKGMLEIADKKAAIPRYDTKPREFHSIIPPGHDKHSTWNAFIEKQAGIGDWDNSGLSDDDLKKVKARMSARNGFLSKEYDDSLLKAHWDKLYKDGSLENDKIKAQKAGGADNTKVINQNAATVMGMTTGFDMGKLVIGTPDQRDYLMDEFQRIKQRAMPAPALPFQFQPTAPSKVDMLSAPLDLNTLGGLPQADQVEILRALSPEQLNGARSATRQEAEAMLKSAGEQPSPLAVPPPEPPAVAPIPVAEPPAVTPVGGEAPLATPAQVSDTKANPTKAEQLKIINDIKKRMEAGEVFVDANGRPIRPIARGIKKQDVAPSFMEKFSQTRAFDIF